MKILKALLLVLIVITFSPLTIAQDRFKKELLDCLSNQNCNQAELYYNAYEINHGKNLELKRQIGNCYIEKVYQYLNDDICDSAQFVYNEYKRFTGKADKTLEFKMVECNKPKTGYLKIGGNIDILSKSLITIINDEENEIDGKSCIWEKQELPIGDYLVRIENDSIIPINKELTIIKGEITRLWVDVESNYAIVTFVVNSKNAEILFHNPKNDEWENMGNEKWDARLEFGSYEIKCQKRGFKDSFTHVDINKSSGREPYELNAPIPKGKFFITVNFAYSVIPQESYGFSLGYVNRFGGFFSFMGYGLNNGAGITANCDAKGFLKDGTLPNYIEEKTKRSRLSVMAGGIMRISESLYGRIGVGYGERNLYWGTEEGSYYRNLGYSVVKNRFDISGGLQLHINPVVFSLDYVVTGFKFSQFSEIKFGIGIAL